MPVSTGVPNTGYMIVSMVTATTHNIAQILKGEEPSHEPTWNAFCLADLGDKRIAFVAQPQSPPRNVNSLSDGKWVHLAKVAFEKYFIRKVKKGLIDLYFEKYVLNMLNLTKLKDTA